MACCRASGDVAPGMAPACQGQSALRAALARVAAGYRAPQTAALCHTIVHEQRRPDDRGPDAQVAHQVPACDWEQRCRLAPGALSALRQRWAALPAEAAC